MRIVKERSRSLGGGEPEEELRQLYEVSVRAYVTLGKPASVKADNMETFFKILRSAR